jgi:hypothetical protein
MSRIDRNPAPHIENLSATLDSTTAAAQPHFCGAARAQESSTDDNTGNNNESAQRLPSVTLLWQHDNMATACNTKHRYRDKRACSHKRHDNHA